MKSRIIRYLRFALVTILFVMTFASLSSSPKLEAQQTRSGNEFDYYSDDTYTELVGVWIWCSDGSNYRWGQTSGYSIISPSGC